jgi:hypothetical protein
MNTGLRVEFTVARERARRAAIVKRALRATPSSPAVVLCASPAVARSVERSIASEGGAWVTVIDWPRLMDALERAAGLERMEAPHEATRVLWVERSLEALRREDRALSAALSVDPSSVARALLRSADIVRAAFWRGEQAIVEEACAALERAVEAPVRAHLELISCAASAVERGLREARLLDGIARMRRWIECDSRVLPPSWRELYVDGADYLSPIERAVLEALADAGARVDVAPWVWGWRRTAARPADDPTPPESSLEALARFPLGEQVESDDGRVVECSARDPEDEANAVAEWVASLPESERARVAIAVPGALGDGPRVLRALERFGARGAWKGSVSATVVPLWGVVRSAVRLAWRGPDALDLATVLSSPGSGTWGSDRDRIVARLRAGRDHRWSDVRAAVIECTDPAEHAFASVDEGSERVFDPARAAALEQQRKSVLALINELEGEAPFREVSHELRVHRLRTLVHSVLQRFANAQRIRASVRDARASAWWVASASAIRDAMRAVLEGVEREPAVLASRDPTPLLLRVERMLPALADGVDHRRADRVRVVSESDPCDERPAILVVLGFARGRYPAEGGSTPWLGSVERAALGRSSIAALSELPDEGVFAQIAQRNTQRLLASPTERLVLVRPHRDGAGSTLEPCSTRAVLLDAFAPSVAAMLERRALSHVRSVLTPLSETVAARRRRIAARVGEGLDDEALALIDEFARAHPEPAMLFEARLAPSRDFAVASALRPLLDKPEYSPADLELATKCAFAFATRSVLRLRWLPLAAGPKWGPRALMIAAHRAVRALDASDGDVERALDVAMEHDEAKGASLEAAGARRVLRSFVRRFGLQRKRWKATEIAVPRSSDSAGEKSDEGSSVEIDLPCEHPSAPKRVRVRAEVARVEQIEDGPSRRAVIVDLRMGKLEDEQARRILGVGAASAVLPAVVEKQYGVEVDALATVSLQRADTKVVAREGAFGEGATDASLTAVAAEAKRRFSVVFDAIAAGDAPVLPHDHARRAALETAGIRSCEGCPSRLLCRFDMQGETP